MKRLVVLNTLVVSLALWAAPVGAASLKTGVGFLGVNGGAVDALLCTAVNAGTKPIKSVKVELINHLGVVAESTCLALAASNVCEAHFFGGNGSSAWCAVTFTGGKNNMRASLVGYNQTTIDPLVVWPAN